MSCTIRPAHAEDATDIATLFLATRKACIPYAPLAHDDDDVHHWVRKVLVPAGGVSVLSDGEQVLGFVASCLQNGEAWIDLLYVQPHLLRRGTGSRLLQHALKQLPRPVHLYCF